MILNNCNNRRRRNMTFDKCNCQSKHSKIIDNCSYRRRGNRIFNNWNWNHWRKCSWVLEVGTDRFFFLNFSARFCECFAVDASFSWPLPILKLNKWITTEGKTLVKEPTKYGGTALILTKYFLFYKHKANKYKANKPTEAQMLGKISILLSIPPAKENLVILTFFPQIK